MPQNKNQEALDALFDKHALLGGSAHTYKAVREGGVGKDILAAIEAAYDRGVEDTIQVYETEEVRKTAPKKAKPSP